MEIPSSIDRAVNNHYDRRRQRVRWKRRRQHSPDLGRGMARSGVRCGGDSMRLVIDGHRLTSERTGVGRCLESLLADWAETGLPLAETLVVLRDRGGLSRVPEAPGLEARVVGEGWPGLAWECLGLGRVLRPDDLLFAPANLVPP